MSIETDSSSPDLNAAREKDDFDRLINDPSQRRGVDACQAQMDVNSENTGLDKRDRKKELTVAGTLLGVSIVDAFLFMHIGNWSAPFVVGAIQLLAALIFAKNYGVEEIQVWLNKIIEKFPTNGNGKDQPRDK